MSIQHKNSNGNSEQAADVRWVTDPLSLDKLRIIPGHQQAADQLVPHIVGALKSGNKVIFAAGGESGTGKSEVAYLIGEGLRRQGIDTVAWSFDNAYVTTPEEREKKRAEDYDNNVGLNEMNVKRISEVISAFEQDASITVPVVVINEDGSRPIKKVTLEMKDKKVLIFDGLYAAMVGKIDAGESGARRIIAMSEKRFSLDAQKERGKEKVNEHRMKVLERECRAVRSLWPQVTHKITEDWQVVAAG